MKMLFLLLPFSLFACECKDIIQTEYDKIFLLHEQFINSDKNRDYDYYHDYYYQKGILDSLEYLLHLLDKKD